MKTTAVKRKAATKIAKAKRKINRKCKGKCAAVVAAIGLAALATGCATTESAQPAKANTMNNTFDECIIVVATHASVSNRIVTAEGTKDIPAIELFTQTQSLENSGTDTTSQEATQTPTVSTPVRVDARYNDALAAATPASRGILESLLDVGKDAVLAMMAAKKTGTVTVDKKDGTQTTIVCKDGQCYECKDGQCTLGNTPCADGACNPR